MKKLVYVASYLLIAGAPTLIWAKGELTNVSIGGTDVTQLVSTGPSAFFVTFHVTIGGTPPACAVQTQRFVADLSTPGGQGMAAAILAAQMGGRNVDIVGRGTCDIWADTESIAYINVY